MLGRPNNKKVDVLSRRVLHSLLVSTAVLLYIFPLITPEIIPPISKLPTPNIPMTIIKKLLFLNTSDIKLTIHTDIIPKIKGFTLILP